MITEAILNAFMIIPNLIISLIPMIEFEIPSNILISMSDIFYGIGYLLPIDKLMPIIVAGMIIQTLRLTTAILWRIKSFIPTMGK